AWIPRFRNIVVIAAGAAFIPFAHAAVNQDDAHGDRPQVYDARLANVPLQPFTLDRPIETRRAIRVAYYAPRAVPHAEPNPSNKDIEPDWEIDHSSAGHPTVPGTRAMLRGGVAYAPANAPDQVKEAIWAVNTIRHKPYHWGGGHGSFYDSGYDCSGAVSFALHSAGALYQPLPSSD